MHKWKLLYRAKRIPSALLATLSLTLAILGVAFFVWPLTAFADGAPQPEIVGVGPEYDTSHVYVAPGDLDRFADSVVATFGGRAMPQVVLDVTPTPSETLLRAIIMPVGLISAFGFETPIPYAFGSERTGYLVTDMDAAVRAARINGADIVVAPFHDPIGRDAIIEWPGGVYMQLYWHPSRPHYAPLAAEPENRVYLSKDKADEFIRDFVHFAHCTIVSDDSDAPGIEIGNASETYRRVRIESLFGKMTVLVTDGHLPYPYGRETTGYEVANLANTLEKATSSGATVLVAPYVSGGREAAIVEFPGGYIAEIHSSAPQ